MDVKSAERLIRDVPDFPKPGIVFKDITPLLQDPAGWRAVVDEMCAQVGSAQASAMVGVESRGFLFAAPMAYQLNVGLALVRKPGKLPADTLTQEYALEYGTDRLEVHRDAFEPGQPVIIVDDVLATGGTAEAAAALVREAGAHVVGFAFLVELSFLGGRERLGGVPVHSVYRY